jgi:hypothetical protein
MSYILQFISPAICTLCKSITVNFNTPQKLKHRHVDSYYARFYPVKISATIIADSNSHTLPYRASITQLRGGQTEGCPLCSFLLETALRSQNSDGSIANTVSKLQSIELEFEVPAAFKDGRYRPESISFKERFQGPYRISMKMYSELSETQSESKWATATFDGYTNFSM